MWREYGPELFGKDVELDSEVIPQVRHMPLSNSAGPGRAPHDNQYQNRARSFGVAGPMAYSTFQ